MPGLKSSKKSWASFENLAKYNKMYQDIIDAYTAAQNAKNAASRDICIIILKDRCKSLINLLNHDGIKNTDMRKQIADYLGDAHNLNTAERKSPFRRSLRRLQSL